MDRRTERDRPLHRGEISQRAKVTRSVVSSLTHPFMRGLELSVRALMCVLWKGVEGEARLSRKCRVLTSRRLPSLMALTGSQCQLSTCPLPASDKRCYYTL